MTQVPNQEPPPDVDITRPSVARAYDFALGGKDNYEVDRKVVEQARSILPELFEVARVARDFLIRVSRFMAGGAEIAQLIDCGSGLPTAENTHHVVQRINVDARVVYLDNDPVVAAHGRALLAENDRTFLVSVDCFDPPQVLENPEVRRHIDFDEPVGLLMINFLHYFTGTHDELRALMKEYVDALPAGSYVALSMLHDPEEDELAGLIRQFEATMRGGFGAGTFCTMSEIKALFDGLDLLEPGVVPVSQWWPDGPQVDEAGTRGFRLLAGGVARKP